MNIRTFLFKGFRPAADFLSGWSSWRSGRNSRIWKELCGCGVSLSLSLDMVLHVFTTRRKLTQLSAPKDSVDVQTAG